MPIVWIYRGHRWPDNERLQGMSVEDAKRAEAGDWGHRVEGLDGREVRPIRRAPHAEADEYFTRVFGARTAAPSKPPPEAPAPPAAPSGGEYGNREMTSVRPPNKGGRPPKQKDERPWPES